MNSPPQKSAFRPPAGTGDARGPLLHFDDVLAGEYVHFPQDLALEIDRAIGPAGRIARPHLPAAPIGHPAALRLISSMAPVMPATDFGAPFFVPRASPLLVPRAADSSAVAAVPDLAQLLIPRARVAMKPRTSARNATGEKVASEARKNRRIRRRPKGWKPIPREQRVYKICSNCGTRNHVRRLCCEKCYTAKAEMRIKDPSNDARSKCPGFPPPATEPGAVAAETGQM